MGFSSSPRRQRILTEALLVYIVTIGLIAGFYQLRGISIINQYLWTLAMLLQVYVPAWAMQRLHLPLSATGLHLQQYQKSIRLWLLCCLVVLPPATFGHHLWQQFNGHSLNTAEATYRQYSFTLRGAPPEMHAPKRVQVYVQPNRPIVEIRWFEPLEGSIYSDKAIDILQGRQWLQSLNQGRTLRVSGGRLISPILVQLRVQGSHLRFRLQRDGAPLPLQDLRFGPQQQIFSKPEIERGFGWILYLLVAQLLMVALPEELFYRGYLLTRFDAVFPVRSVAGIPMSWGNLIVSILFAITHFLIGFEPHRLSVFFPSLLFGALKQRTNSLLAPILFHATANLLIKMLEVWYT